MTFNVIMEYDHLAVYCFYYFSLFTILLTTNYCHAKKYKN